MGDEVGNKIIKDKLQIVDEEGKTVDVVGVTEIKAEDIDFGFAMAEPVGTLELDIKIPRMKRKRMKKLLMSEGYDRNTSEKLCNAYKNMYGSRSYLGLNFFLSYIKFLGDDMCILEI